MTTVPMPALSAVIITYNEEANIARCLDSLMEVADELLVVDSFSTDRTVAIAQEKGARVLEHPFEGHIQQKNHAMDRATHDLVLSLDADEALSQEAVRSVQRVKGAPGMDAYRLPRMTNYCGQWIRHCGWYPDRKLRLWDRKKGRWGGMNPHDRVEMEKGARIADLEGDILHYSFPSIRSHAETANKFSEIVAAERHRKGKRPGIIFHLLLNPSFTFFKKYVLRGGFLDGYYGFVICVLSAYYNFLKYAKARALFREKGHPSRDQIK